MENINDNKSIQFQAKLSGSYKVLIEEFLKNNPGITQADLLKAMIDDGVLDRVKKSGIDKDSVFYQIKTYWAQIAGLVTILHNEKKDAKIFASNEVQEELNNLKNNIRTLSDDAKKYKDENEKLKLQIGQVAEYKSQIEALKKDKEELSEQNSLLRNSVIDSEKAKELKLENERLRTEIERLNGELKYQSGYAAGLKDKESTSEAKLKK